MFKFYIVFIWLFCIELNAQYFQSSIDTVYKFLPGTGQNLGQSSEFFPQNIFGLPDTNASEITPSSDPKQICSIGLGGEIVVGFKNYIIFDGDGPDFTIFENAFINPVTKKVFAEPAIVSVSEDGIKFYDFPYDAKTLVGCAGITPTNGKANPYDVQNSGGDKFDLSIIGLSRAKYIKIRDICNEILKNPDHPFYDPIISGFDLDAVLGLNLIKEISNVGDEKIESYSPILITHRNSYELITYEADNEFFIYNYIGKKISSGNFSYNLVIENIFDSSSIYFLIIKNKKNIHQYKLIF